MDLAATCQFPGIDFIESFSVTLGHGIAPSVFDLTITPQPNPIGQGGDFTVESPDMSRTFSNCKVQSASFRYDQSGALVSLCIVDRRWMWAFGSISGNYNQRVRNNTIVKSKKASNASGQGTNIIQDTEQTPQQLATLCLQAMGETNYDVGDLPNDARPTVEWANEVPARALERICEQNGCRVVLQSDDSVAIRVLGQGAQLPNGFYIDFSDAIDPPQQPDSITVSTAPIRFQYDLELEPVGEDTDGSIKTLNQLTYAPDKNDQDGGFKSDGTDLLAFSNIKQIAIELAKKTVFKWYRVTFDNSITVKDPADGSQQQLTQLRQIVPIEDVQCDTYTDDEGFTKSLPATVFGLFYSETLGELENTQDEITPPTTLAQNPADGSDGDNVVHESFDIDRQRAIVRFSKQVISLDLNDPANAVAQRATLRLRVAFSVRDNNTNAFVRYERNKNIGGNFGTQPRYLKHDEIIVNCIAQYGDSYGSDPQVKDNTSTVNPECDYYITAAQNDYKQKEPQTMKYAGLLDVELDGALQSITWEWSQAGATTRIGRNQELGTVTTVPYQLRRFAVQNSQTYDIGQSVSTGAKLQNTIRQNLQD